MNAFDKILKGDKLKAASRAVKRKLDLGERLE